jgi:hypothetical protein
LIKQKGIEEKRLQANGVGSKYPLKDVVQYNGYKKMTFKKGELNCRVGIKVFSLDYGVPSRSDVKDNSLFMFYNDGNNQK